MTIAWLLKCTHRESEPRRKTISLKPNTSKVSQRRLLQVNAQLNCHWPEANLKEEVHWLSEFISHVHRAGFKISTSTFLKLILAKETVYLGARNSPFQARLRVFPQNRRECRGQCRAHLVIADKRTWRTRRLLWSPKGSLKAPCSRLTITFSSGGLQIAKKKNSSCSKQ